MRGLLVAGAIDAPERDGVLPFIRERERGGVSLLCPAVYRVVGGGPGEIVRRAQSDGQGAVVPAAVRDRVGLPVAGRRRGGRACVYGPAVAGGSAFVAGFIHGA